MQRLISFGLVVGVGFLLLVSLLVSAALAALSRYLGQIFPALTAFWEAANVLVSLFVITLLFAMVYKILPDVRLRWRDVWIGALVTAGFFSIGKQLIGLYLGTSSVGSSYGAAGSVVVLLIWVYYSAQVVLLGAEFTRFYVERFRGQPPPMKHAQPDPSPPAAFADAAPVRRSGGRAVGRAGGQAGSSKVREFLNPVTLSAAKGACLNACPLRCAQGDDGLAVKARDCTRPPDRPTARPPARLTPTSSGPARSRRSR